MFIVTLTRGGIKKEYFEDNTSVKDDKNLEPTNSF